MEIFVDSASITEIKKWLNMGIIDDVTTNPSIMLKDGVYDAEAGAKEIAAIVNPRPVSVEVTTNDLDEMLTQAQRFASWAPNIAIKIPQITQDGIPCYNVTRQLESEGINLQFRCISRACENNRGIQSVKLCKDECCCPAKMSP